MLRTTALVAALMMSPLAAFSAPWVLDKTHAHITFSVSHLGFSDTQGAFREFDMDIEFDPDNVEASKVNVTVNAASVDTFFAKRDEHIRNKDFLDIENHPTITFTSTEITKTGDNTADVTGDLTILGTTAPVTLQATLVNMGPSPFDPNKTIAGMKVTGEIDRAAYGVSYGVPAIGQFIPVEIDFEMSPAQ